ncbi:hypothetical protein BDV36DRAFT_292774 [Aspergillus pseudocaelatus]|uniref:F-box domain-containing protein n=1 Tax=Aspergillus pseudocaelatus TaxID=1825620 RepID=A0ABQ6WUQ6_9EURO|nr:hypothetical protein BDV36DRAFT_292774 [Aspergillus pseudocaelatus]
MTHETIACLPQETVDQIAVFVGHERGSSAVLKNLRLVSRPFYYSASRVLFREFYIAREYAGFKDSDRRDGIKAFLELSRSGISHFIGFMRVSGPNHLASSGLTEEEEEEEQADTIANALQGNTRPKLKALDLCNISDSMLHEFCQPAMAPIIAGLWYLKIIGCRGRSNGVEIQTILQYCESVRAVEWINCETFFDRPTGIIHPKAPLERIRLNGMSGNTVASPLSLLATVCNARNTIRYLSVYPMKWQSAALEEQVDELVGELTSCPFLYHPNMGSFPESLARRYGCTSISQVLKSHTKRVIHILAVHNGFNISPANSSRLTHLEAALGG